MALYESNEDPGMIEAMLNFDMDAFIAKELASREGSTAASPISSSSVGNAGGKRPSREWHAEAEVALSKYFGFECFREGQKEVVDAVLSGRDVNVLWSTGSGKSICYQLPALVTGKTTVVISPLISLMQDQVMHLNNFLHDEYGRDAAIFLGSSQRDSSARDAALRGEYLFVYLTPEYLNLTGFVQDLARCLGSAHIGLIAVDESHCVSEWGHDFRADYRTLGVFRTTPELAGVPIIALTATATPEVKTDIAKSLGLRTDHFESKKSVDRSNLDIIVKQFYGIQAAMKSTEEIVRGEGSTIVYASTKADAEKCAVELRVLGVECALYHGGLSSGEREAAHKAFLTGSSKCVCATVAFGMGIDKPDIRNVVHVGAPKSPEEYYQQIGRAGRDGLKSTVILFYEDNILSKYASDFYIKLFKDNSQRMKAYTCALHTMRDFATKDTCRRAFLMQYFGETPPASGACEGCSCDVCVRRGQGGITKRDFQYEAHLILSKLSTSGATSSIGAVSKSILMSTSLRKDKILLDKYRNLTTIEKVLFSSINSVVFSLERLNYLGIGTKSSNVNGRDRTWTVYYMKAPLPPVNQSLVLPIPQVLQDQELEQKRTQERIRSNKISMLESEGVDIEQVPQDELDSSMGGPWLAFHRRVRGLRARGSDTLADFHEGLLKAILEWRKGYAQLIGMAPHSVLTEAFARKVALSRVSDAAALREAGLRARGAPETLSVIIGDFLKRHERVLAEAGEDVQGAANSSDGPLARGGGAIILPTGEYTPPGWSNATLPKKHPASWEVSTELFCGQGRSIQSIALHRSFQPRTILGHLLQSLCFKQCISLTRLVGDTRSDPSQSLSPPSYNEWVEIEAAASKVSGPMGGIRVLPESKDFNKGLVLRYLSATSAIAAVEFSMRSQDQCACYNYWANKVEWWLALTRACVPVTFQAVDSDLTANGDGSTKRLKTESHLLS